MILFFKFPESVMSYTSHLMQLSSLRMTDNKTQLMQSEMQCLKLTQDFNKSPSMEI